MGDRAVSSAPSGQGNELTPRLCGCGCGRQATKASGYTWSYWCDPAVSAQEKRASRQLGGRRGQMTPAEVVKALEGTNIDTIEGRNDRRDRLWRLRMANRITSSMFRDGLAALEGAAKDVERSPKTKAATTIIVEPQHFGAGNGREEPRA